MNNIFNLPQEIQYNYKADTGKSTYFALCASQYNIKLPEDNKLLSKYPYEIIASNMSHLHLTGSYISHDNSLVEKDLLSIVDWLIGKNGIIVMIDESSICLSSGSLNALINSIDSMNPFSVILNQDSSNVCAFCADINSLLTYFTSFNVAVDSLSGIYFNMLLNSVSVKNFSLDMQERLQLDGAISYSKILAYLNQNICEGHMRKGVYIVNSSTCHIDFDVKIGEGSVIYPNNVLKGKTVIGKNCVLHPNNRIENSCIAEECTIDSSVILDSDIGKHTTVGPFAYLRPNSKIGSSCRIGDFVEIKNSNIDDGTKVSHLTYVGDSDLGKNINLGCGVVFVNYDGKIKQRCVVEDNAFIGCNTNLVAPVQVGKNAYVAAGSTITENVPDDALYIARAKGVIKPDWAKKRREDGKLK